MIPLIVIRPEPGCSASVAAAQALGLTAYGFPLFDLRPVACAKVNAKRFDAMLIGSANALRHGGGALAACRALPVYVVGETTAKIARAAGLTVASIGSGGLQSVLDAIAPGTKVLRLCGHARVTLTPPPGVTMTERVVYASDPLPLPLSLAAMLVQPCVVLLHSGEAARHFANQCDRLAIPRKGIRLAAIAPRVADMAGAGWAELHQADVPCESALLAIARQLCQSGSTTEA